MQMAVIEYARNKAGLVRANSAEVDKNSPHKVIHVMKDQEEYLTKKQYGGTIRLGAWPCKLEEKTKLAEIYKKWGEGGPWNEDREGVREGEKTEEGVVWERHRHRYEFNNEYRETLEKAGLVISGTSPDGRLVEAIEIKDHPFFVVVQFHPEYISRPLSPHPLFVGLVEAMKNK
jgi:CTP synthase